MINTSGRADDSRNGRRYIASTLLLVVVVWFGCNSTPNAPARPALVPVNAVWAGGVDGGNFFECDIDTQQNVNRCLVYNEYTGDVSGGGFFQLSGSNRAAHQSELQYSFFDGRIGLASGILVPVVPVPPKEIPRDAAFANGLFIKCGDMISGRVQCRIYRPDGIEYFKGSFTPDASLGGKVEDGYKFFDLSDRTIHLLSGGALVAK